VITDYVAINVSSRSQQHLQAMSLLRARRLQRHANVRDVITVYAAISMHRKRRQHLLVVPLLRAMRMQLHAVVPDVITVYAAIACAEGVHLFR